jgi:hypothetical protein
MTTLELVAALVLAAVVLWLVLGPMYSAPAVARAPNPLDDLVDPLETPRGRALEAIRELEFDRATGKIGDRDFAELSARYSAEALQVLRTETAPPGVPTCEQCGPRPESDARYCSSCGADLTTSPRCGQCGVPLLASEKFCTQCGAATGTT